MRLLSIAARARPTGYVVLADGESLQSDRLALLVGRPAEEIEPLLGELSRNGVFSRDGKGRIYSRRMVRDAKQAALGKKNADKRWGGKSQHADKKDEKSNPIGGAIGIPSEPPTHTSKLQGLHKIDDDEDAGASGRVQFDEATERVIEAAGADPSKQAAWMTAAAHVQKWLQRGCDLDLDVLPAVRSVMVNRRGQGPPDGPNYFTKRILETMDARLRPLPEITAPTHGGTRDGRTPRQREIDARRAEQGDAFRDALGFGVGPGE